MNKRITIIIKNSLLMFVVCIIIFTCSVSVAADMPNIIDQTSPAAMIVTENFYKDYVVNGVTGYSTVRISVDITYDAQNDRIISVSNAKAYENGMSWLGDWETVSVSVTKDQYFNVYVHVTGDLTITYFDIYGFEVSDTTRHNITATFTV